MYISARYLAKYVQGIDKHSRAVVHACSRQKNAAEITQQNVMNVKITSSKINEQKRKFSNRACRKPQGRIIGLMEMMAYVLKYPMVYTNVEFVHVPPVPLE